MIVLILRFEIRAAATYSTLFKKKTRKLCRYDSLLVEELKIKAPLYVLICASVHSSRCINNNNQLVFRFSVTLVLLLFVFTR